MPQGKLQARVIAASGTHSEGAAGGAAAVDQLADRVGVVDEIRGEGRVGELVGVCIDKGLEVVGDLLCVGVGHAVGGGLLGTPGSPRCGGCMGSGYESGKCEGGGTHVGEDVLVFGKSLVRKAEVLSECVLDVETIVGVVVRCERLVGRKIFPVDMSLATYSLPRAGTQARQIKIRRPRGLTTLGNWQQEPATPSNHTAVPNLPPLSQSDRDRVVKLLHVAWFGGSETTAHR
jgi:hypothetical protein